MWKGVNSMHYVTSHKDIHSPAASNILTFDQNGVVRSIREKCGLIENLYSGSQNWIFNIERSKYNKNTIEELIGSIYHMLDVINDEYHYLDAAREIEKVLLKMNRVKEAADLYTYRGDRFNA
jgi:hypothetical protein